MSRVEYAGGGRKKANKGEFVGGLGRKVLG